MPEPLSQEACKPSSIRQGESAGAELSAGPAFSRERLSEQNRHSVRGGESLEAPPQTLTVARECADCPPRVLRCVHYDGHSVFMVIGHEHTIWAGDWAVYIDAAPNGVCGRCGEVTFWAQEAEMYPDRALADRAFDLAVARLLGREVQA